ncbi:MAG: rod shape-determining protein MreC [Syntrophales bacterium]|jgi:rod shape-determining protein MreC|nr:rod shape-determining protein MreC [Syntrophales bacterium]
MQSLKKKYYLLFLVFLFILVLGFFSYQLHSSPNSGFIHKIVLETTFPLESIMHDSMAGVREIWRRYLFLYGLTEENDRLRKTNARLSRKVFEYREAYLENIRLRKLLAFKEKLPYETQVAGVTRHDMSGVMKTLMIDVGENDGIRKGQPVIVEAGLVGRVVDTTWHASRVLVVTDENSNVDVLVQRTRANGILQGTGAGRCKLKYIVKTDPVKKGDIALTSGLGGVFPKGLVVGVVGGVEHSKASMFQNIEVVPFADFHRMEEVLVIIGK